MINSQVLAIYSKTLIDELKLRYIEKSLNIKEELRENIKSQGTFSITFVGSLVMRSTVT